LAAGLRPDPLGSLQRFPDPLAGFKGSYFWGGKGRRRGEGEREGGKGKRRGKGRKGAKGGERKGRGKGPTPPPRKKSWRRHWYSCAFLFIYF